jgi:ABC-2 type transport system permease protein
MTARGGHQPPGRYRFRHLARMEWIKLRSLRSTWLTLTAMTSEYTSGAISATFAAAPRRLGGLAAKAAVVGAVALVTGEAAAFLSFFAGCLTLHHGITAAALDQSASCARSCSPEPASAWPACSGSDLEPLPLYIVSHSLGATGPACLPDAASCWLSPWNGLGMLAGYAVLAMLVGGLILAWRDA